MLASFFTNPWSVGIGGGILSGFVFFVITWLIFSRKESREYKQKVLAANREILHGVRPTISEDHLPDRQIIGSMITATARRFSVNSADMQSVEQFVDDLVMEVMESSFISSPTKADFCSKLAVLKTPPAQPELVQTKDSEQVSARVRDQRRRLMAMTSAILALLAGLMTASVIFVRVERASEPAEFAPAFAVAGTLVVVITGFIVVRLSMVRRSFHQGREGQEERNHREKVDGDDS